MKKIRKTVDLYTYIVIFFLIYLEWGYACVINESLTGIVKTALMIALVLPLFLYKTFKFRKENFALFVFLSIVILLSSLRDSNFGNTILLFVPLFCGFVFTSAIKFENAVDKFCNTMSYLSGISLVVFFLSLVLPSFIQRFPIMVNVWGTPIHNLLISVAPSNVSFVRNYGITWEPGAFSLLLCISIFCLIVCYERLNKRKLTICIAALITTFSTMGYIVLVIILFITRFKSVDTKHSRTGFFISILIVFGLFFFFTDDNNEMLSIVFGKLSGFSFGDDNPETTQARVNAIIFPWFAFLSNPILGIGYDAFKGLNETVCNNVATNTIMNWFALGGILLGGPCSYFYFKLVAKTSRRLKLNKLQLLVLFISFALLISTESLLRISLIYMIIFYGCSNANFVKNA
ncbi:MAG: hypothetical protein RRY07_10480 [Bacteroidaceae bacterium]